MFFTNETFQIWENALALDLYKLRKVVFKFFPDFEESKKYLENKQNKLNLPTFRSKNVSLHLKNEFLCNYFIHFNESKFMSTELNRISLIRKFCPI